MTVDGMQLPGRVDELGPALVRLARRNLARRQSAGKLTVEQADEAAQMLGLVPTPDPPRVCEPLPRSVRRRAQRQRDREAS